MDWLLDAAAAIGAIIFIVALVLMIRHLTEDEHGPRQ